jgi:hypothetical protein
MSQDIQIIKIEEMGEIIEHVIIDRGNGEFTSMPKSVYDAQQAKPDTGWTEPTLTKF